MIFDQYQRYKLIQILAQGIKEYYGLKKISILELGANEQLNLGEFLPEEEITYSDIIVPDSMKNNKNFIQADATNLNKIADNSYDVVISLDVFEHIEKHKRKDFLLESNRVAKLTTIHCFPFGSQSNISAELRANEYYKSMFGKNHIWLEEHINNGLPNINDLNKVIESFDENIFMFEHGDITLWEELMKSLFYTYYVPELSPLRERIEDYYQQNIFSHDIGEQNYRKFLIMTEDKELNKFLKSSIEDKIDNKLPQKDLQFLYRNIDDLHSISQLPIYREKLESNESSTLYLDTGNGFNENSKIINKYKIKNSMGFIDLKIDIDNISSIRFDPVEGKACILSGLNIISNNGRVKFTLLNGSEIDNLSIFNNDDPQILIELEKSVKWIKIQSEISIVESSLSINALNKLISVKEADNQNSEIINKLNIIQNNLDENNKVIIKLNNKIIENDSEKCKLKNEIKEMSIEKEDISNQLTDITNAYNEIVNSRCWRITTPIRKTLDYFKENRKDKGLVSKDGNDILYNIEKFDYENNIFELNGWIFGTEKKITDLKLLVISGEQEYRISILNSLERKDVFDLYKNENSLYSGFYCKVKMENIKKIFIYLEVNNKKILVNKLTGSLREQIEFYKKKLTRQNIKKAIRLIKNNDIITLKNASKRLVIEPINSSFESINLKEFEKQHTCKYLSYPEELYNETIDIIIPVYNGYEYFNKLFETIKNTKMNYRLIIINDNSSDGRVNDFLKEYSNRENVILINNDTNLGFVKSVNKGFNIAKNNIALVNTDVELPDMWLERLMMPIILHKNIASSTPFTNCGTICSFPEFCKDNEIFEGLSVNEIDSEFKHIKPSYIEVPTGVGFCMGMNKKTLDKIGLFDDDTFEKGYGEENDWCQRAIKAGFINVQVENLYVYHKHGGSFKSEEKKKLIEKNSILLSKKHPNYNSDVGNFCNINPAQNIRNHVIYRLLSSINDGTLVYFDHNIGGGATNYLNDRVNKELSENKHILIIRYDISIRGYLINYKYKKYNISYYCNKFEDVLEILRSLKLEHIYVNELVTYPSLYKILDSLIELKMDKETRMTMFLHDYFALCPTINLLNDKKVYCNIPSMDKCKECLKKNAQNHYFDYEDIEKWRKTWNELLVKCDEIIVFSNNSKELLLKTYNSLNNITVKPHLVNYMIPLNKRYKKTTTLNIGLMGVLNYHKGIEIIRKMLAVIDKQNLDVNIILIGSTTESINSEHFRQTGMYTPDMIPKLVLENDIDLFFISSICPETFSYTTQEVINMNMPIVSFDIGAPAERIRNYDKGLVLSSFESEKSLYEIMEFGKTFEYKYIEHSKRVLFIVDYHSFSSRYRVDHFREQLLVNGISSECILADSIEKYYFSDYDVAVIYRCNYSHKIEKFISYFHDKGKKVFYDIDDYIFNYNDIKDLEFLKDKEYANFSKHSLDVYKCMEMCDGYLTSTENMKKAIASTIKNKPICVNRNVASMEMLSISLLAKSKVYKDKNKVIIGYFSGSKTHDKDFEEISDILLEALINNKNVYLKIGGCLKLSNKFDCVREKIEFLEFVDWKKLPYYIAGIDINLLPVENTFFHSCKSENKWTEAALVGVPTIATRNSELERVIDSGKTGLLCSSKDEWKESINMFINDYECRKKIAEEAHKFIIENYVTNNSGYSAIDFIFNT